MRVSGIDHVTIATTDVEGSARFYLQLMGLQRGRSPIETTGRKGAWLLDEDGNALVHLVGVEEATAGTTTGGFDHVAFRCSGFDEAVQRVEALGVPCFRNELKTLGLRQLILDDPNGVKLELNFTGD